VIAAAWTGESPPYDLIYAMLLDRFKKLPSEVDQEDADQLMRSFSILNIFDEYAAKAARAKRK
jgi:hypothetical protein